MGHAIASLASRFSRFGRTVLAVLPVLAALTIWTQVRPSLTVAAQKPSSGIAPARLFSPPPVVCNGGNLPLGNGQDLQVTGPCLVTAGDMGAVYNYHNVNIFTAAGAKQGGTLTFADARIRFYAESIVIENGGSLIAGTPTSPIGTSAGQVEIHLWGAPTDPGIVCKSPPPPGQTVSTCGVPLSIWNSNNNNTMFPNSCNSMTLSNGVNDCFYSYEVFDNNDVAGAYFGHKVLAVG